MPPDSRQLAVFDDRPFFERSLVYGVRKGIIDQEKIRSILDDAPKGMVQIAAYFGTQYLRPNIEQARIRIVNLVSLYLDVHSDSDLEWAARSLRDHSFLSHSRGGSEMLKRLWAMPEDDSYGIHVRLSQKAFLAEWSLKSVADYRQALARREAHQRAIAAALWFAERLGMPVSDISTGSVESIIRTALLVYLSASTPVAIPNPAGLIGLFGAIRQKGVPAKGRKAIEDVFGVLPEAFLGFTREVLKKIESEDLPKILDASWPMNRLIQDLEPLYFLRDFGPEDASAFDAAVSKVWQKITGGKTDDSSLLTIFVCLAAGLPARPALGKAAARALIRKVRTDGFERSPVLAFIRDHAPYQYQDDLEKRWKEFFPDAREILLDAADTSLKKALAFLTENCIVV